MRREGHPQAVAVRADALVLGGEGLDEAVGQRRGRLDRIVGHPVSHVDVPVVTDGRIDRNRAVRDREAQAVVVETGQVERRPAAAQDQHGVEGLGGAFHALQRVHDARGRVLALHRRLEEQRREDEAVGILFQVPPEVAVARRVPRGNYRQAVGQQGRLQLLLLVQQAVRLQLLQRAAALQLGRSEGKARLDFVDRQGQAVELAVAHLHAQQHFHAGGQLAARRFSEIGPQGRETAPPDDGLGFRHDAALLALREIQVAVAVRLGLDGRDFRPQPDPLREGGFDFFPQHGLQFEQVYVLTIHIPTKIDTKFIFSNGYLVQKIHKELLSLSDFKRHFV